LNRHYRRLWCESQDPLFVGDTNYHRRNVFHIDKRVEEFRATKIGKMNDVVRYLRDLAAHFFSGSQVQPDTFAGAALKKADDRRIRLQAGFILRERAGTDYGGNDYSNRKSVAFHNQLILRDFWSIDQQIIHGSRSGGSRVRRTNHAAVAPSSEAARDPETAGRLISHWQAQRLSYNSA